MTSVKPIPDGYPQVSPTLFLDGASAAIEFYAQVFGATERLRMPLPDGRVAHAEIQFGDSVIMLADENPDMPGMRGPRLVGGTPIVLSVYVEDVDSVYQRALAAGATSVSEVEDQFYGDRSGQFEDPFGHRWYVATHVEDVPPEEMERRASKAMGGGG